VRGREIEEADARVPQRRAWENGEPMGARVFKDSPKLEPWPRTIELYSNQDVNAGHLCHRIAILPLNN